MRAFADPSVLAEAVGEQLGPSRWHRVDQDRIDGFAELTGDRQWIHVDRDLACAGPFGGPIAHGYLTVSLLPVLLAEVLRVDGVDLAINKGLDSLRFHHPVAAGGQVRAVASVVSATPRPRGFTELVLAVAVQVAGASRPALTARSRTLLHAR